MFDISRILAIPETNPDHVQCGISAANHRALVQDRGGIKVDGTKAKASLLNKDFSKSYEKAGFIKGDKKLSEARPSSRGMAVTDKKGFQSESVAAQKIKGAIAGQSKGQAKGGKVVKGESPDTRNAGYINYADSRYPKKGKIRLIDYRNKGVNAYVAKLDENGDRKFINDHGKTDPNSYKGKENVKEWSIKKLEDGVYEANSRNGFGSRGIEKSYFSVKDRKIDNYFDNYQQAKEALTPKEKRINKTSLSGSSEKQISYAESVRDKAIDKLKAKGLSPSDIQKAVSDPQTQTARWWLDNKDTVVDKIYNAMMRQKVSRL